MICTVTYNPAVDLTMGFDEELSREKVHRAMFGRYDASGKGINVTRFLHGIGCETTAVAPVGGFTGEFIRANLANEGIGHRLVEINGTTRVNVTTLLESGNYKFNQSGPTVGDDAVTTIHSHLEDVAPDLVHVGGSLPPGLDIDAVDRLAEGPWQTSLDIHGEVLRSVGRGHTICTPNRDELATATGIDIRDRETCWQAAQQVKQWGFEHVLVTLGREGAILLGPDKSLVAKAPDIEAVDPVGGGDAFVAGFLGTRIAGCSLESAMANGIAIATELVSREGAPIPNPDWLERHESSIDVRAR